MIVTIAEHFTSDPSDRERSPTIIWKPGFTMHDSFYVQPLKMFQMSPLFVLKLKLRAL